MSNFLQKFNCPAKFFNVLGYTTVVIGLIMVLIGIIGLICGVGAINSSGAPDSVALNTGAGGFSLVLMGIITAIVCPQLFFAIAKIVKAAEKYLES